MTDRGLPLFQTRTLADQVYDHLLRQISTGVFPPGTPLRELDLVAQLGVSRTPIREALLRLAEYGLLEMAGRSVQVRRLSPEDVQHVFQVREALEGEAIRQACGRLTAEDFTRLETLVADCGEATPDRVAACIELDITLHRLIALRSGNPILAREIRKLHDLMQLAHKQVADSGRLARELHCHRAIIAALRAGDRRGSCRALLGHLRLARQTIVRGALEAAEAESTADPDAAAMGT
jgi:DNA-binding GntR family transcriptional regulator